MQYQTSRPLLCPQGIRSVIPLTERGPCHSVPFAVRGPVMGRARGLGALRPSVPPTRPQKTAGRPDCTRVQGTGGGGGSGRAAPPETEGQTESRGRHHSNGGGGARRCAGLPSAFNTGADRHGAPQHTSKSESLDDTPRHVCPGAGRTSANTGTGTWGGGGARAVGGGRSSRSAFDTRPEHGAESATFLMHCPGSAWAPEMAPTKGVFSHSTNYVVHPGNTPETIQCIQNSIGGAEFRTLGPVASIRLKQKFPGVPAGGGGGVGCRLQDSGTRDCRWWKTADFAHSTRCGPEEQTRWW